MKLYTIAETADLLKTSKKTVYQLIKDGRLRALKLGRLKISEDELRRFVSQEMEAAHGEI